MLKVMCPTCGINFVAYPEDSSTECLNCGELVAIPRIPVAKPVRVSTAQTPRRNPLPIFLILTALVIGGYIVLLQSNKNVTNSEIANSKPNVDSRATHNKERLAHVPEKNSKSKLVIDSPMPSIRKLNLGETISVGYMSYCVWNAWWSDQLSKNVFLDDKPDAEFLFIELSVRNNDNKARTIPPFLLIDQNGAEYNTTSKAWQVDGGLGLLVDLNPSVTKRGKIVFDIPRNRHYKLIVSGGFWSLDRAIIDLN